MTSEPRQNEDVGLVSSGGSDAAHTLWMTSSAAKAQAQQEITRTSSRRISFMRDLSALIRETKDCRLIRQAASDDTSSADQARPTLPETLYLPVENFREPHRAERRCRATSH